MMHKCQHLVPSYLGDKVKLNICEEPLVMR